ncbi:MAG TPA: lytic transglycosylase domain-containing protein [Terriglobales bacterium]|nr:lytic transglycosylase domain-containing protein [Terriglobales bacterium]
MNLGRKLVAGICLLLALPAFASDLAILQNGFSIRHERRESLGDVTRLYLDATPQSGYIDVPTGQIASIQHDDSLSSPSPQPADAQPAASQLAAPQGATIQDFVYAASQKHGVDADLIQSVIRAESGFNPKAVSRKGAKGLMQLMPATASKLGVADSMDPAANVEGGTHYLHELLQRYNNDLIKALAAYNAGPERVEKYKGVPPYRETYAYVSRIIADFNRKKLAQFAATTQAAKTPRTAKPKASRPAGDSDSSTTTDAQAASD